MLVLDGAGNLRGNMLTDQRGYVYWMYICHFIYHIKYKREDKRVWHQDYYTPYWHRRARRAPKYYRFVHKYCVA